jgi:predicted protein tyrosine phosphatase
MDDIQKRYILNNYRNDFSSKNIINLDIPDKYHYLDSELIDILKNKIEKYYKK